MKTAHLVMILAAVLCIAAAQQCTEKLQVACIDDVREAYPICKKAAEAGGSDTSADLSCLKYFNKMKPECWPCICMVAHMDHLDIKGC